MATSARGTDPPARILVVDDHPGNLLAMCAVLEDLGHEIICARSCRETLRLTLDHAFAVILLDVQLGDGDGFDVLSALQARRDFTTPVLFFSAVFDARAYAQRAYRLGALDYIPKPFDSDVLRGKVSALVLLYQRGEELKRQAGIIARHKDELSDERSRAQAISDDKDRALTIVSHDLRNPLSSIAVGASVLQHQLEGKPQATATRILRSAKRMEVMIRDLLDFARGRFTGGIPVVLSSMDIEEICGAVIEELAAVHPDREIVLQTYGNLRLHCDGSRVEQAVSNLVGNAIEHSASKILLRAQGNEADVAISVHNGPPNIPPEKLERLFEPFRRGDQSGGGLGLGLHIVREIAKAHGGEVHVISTPSEGTTFTLRLPRLRPRPA